MQAWGHMSVGVPLQQRIRALYRWVGILTNHQRTKKQKKLTLPLTRLFGCLGFSNGRRKPRMNPQRHCASSNLPPTDDPNMRLIIRPPLRAPNIGLFSAPPNLIATRIPVLCHHLVVPGSLPGRAHRAQPRRLLLVATARQPRATPPPLRGRSAGSSWAGSSSRPGAKLPPPPCSWVGSFSYAQVRQPHREGRGRRGERRGKRERRGGGCVGDDAGSLPFPLHRFTGEAAALHRTRGQGGATVGVVLEGELWREEGERWLQAPKPVPALGGAAGSGEAASADDDEVCRDGKRKEDVGHGTGDVEEDRVQPCRNEESIGN
jgi:hypothetical protein